MRGNAFKIRMAEFASGHEWKIGKVRTIPAMKKYRPDIEPGNCDCCSAKMGYHFEIQAENGERRYIGGQCFTHIFGEEEGQRIQEAISSITNKTRYSYRKDNQWKQIEELIFGINLGQLINKQIPEDMRMKFKSDFNKYFEKNTKKKKNPVGFASKFLRFLIPDFKFEYSAEFLEEEHEKVALKIDEWIRSYNLSKDFMIVETPLNQIV